MKTKIRRIALLAASSFLGLIIYNDVTESNGLMADYEASQAFKAAPAGVCLWAFIV